MIASQVEAGEGSNRGRQIRCLKMQQLEPRKLYRNVRCLHTFLWKRENCVSGQLMKMKALGPGSSKAVRGFCLLPTRRSIYPSLFPFQASDQGTMRA